MTPLAMPLQRRGDYRLTRGFHPTSSIASLLAAAQLRPILAPLKQTSLIFPPASRIATDKFQCVSSSSSSFFLSFFLSASFFYFLFFIFLASSISVATYFVAGQTMYARRQNMPQLPICWLPLSSDPYVPHRNRQFFSPASRISSLFAASPLGPICTPQKHNYVPH